MQKRKERLLRCKMLAFDAFLWPEDTVTNVRYYTWGDYI